MHTRDSSLRPDFSNLQCGEISEVDYKLTVDILVNRFLGLLCDETHETHAQNPARPT